MNFNQRSRSILKGLFNDNYGRQNENWKHIDREDMVSLHNGFYEQTKYVSRLDVTISH